VHPFLVHRSLRFKVWVLCLKRPGKSSLILGAETLYPTTRKEQSSIINGSAHIWGGQELHACPEIKEQYSMCLNRLVIDTECCFLASSLVQFVDSST